MNGYTRVESVILWIGASGKKEYDLDGPRISRPRFVTVDPLKIQRVRLLTQALGKRS